MTTGDIDSAACRLFIEASTIITTHSLAQPASLPASMPPHQGRDNVWRKRNGGDCRGSRGEDNDGYRKHNQMKRNEKTGRNGGYLEGKW